MAVLIVDYPFPINDYIRPACLPPIGWTENLEGGEMVISGMGETFTGSGVSPTVKIATITMKSKDECKNNIRIGSSFKGELIALNIFPSKLYL